MSPSGRRWLVTGWAERMTKVELLAADGSGDECVLSPSLLRHADGRNAGDLLVNIGYGAKTL